MNGDVLPSMRVVIVDDIVVFKENLENHIMLYLVTSFLPSYAGHLVLV